MKHASATLIGPTVAFGIHVDGKHLQQSHHILSYRVIMVLKFSILKYNFGY